MWQLAIFLPMFGDWRKKWHLSISQWVKKKNAIFLKNVRISSKRRLECHWLGRENRSVLALNKNVFYSGSEPINWYKRTGPGGSSKKRIRSLVWSSTSTASKATYWMQMKNTILELLFHIISRLYFSHTIFPTTTWFNDKYCVSFSNNLQVKEKKQNLSVD